MLNNDKEKDSLISFVKRVAGSELELAEEDYGEGFYRLKTSEAEKRQAQHDIRYIEDALLELLRNSRDANATHIAVSTHLKQSRYREIVVIDNGEGIPEGYHDLIFEPRVTSRLKNLEDAYGVHGRGMALYAIKSRSITAHIGFSKPFCGTSIVTLFDSHLLPEKKNQGERPRYVRIGNEYELRGIKNIFYVLTEFAYKNPKVELYYGSPSEVLSLVLKDSSYSILRQGLGLNHCSSKLNFDKTKEIAESLGLSVSARNIYRVISGEIRFPSKLSSLNTGFQQSTSGIPQTLRFNSKDWKLIKDKVETILKPYVESYGMKIVQISQMRKKGELKIQVILEEN